MAEAPETTANCEDCGATIYPEHLQRRTADRWAGRLLCPHCLSEKRGGGGWTASPGDKSPTKPDAAPDLLTNLPPISAAAKPQVKTSALPTRELQFKRPLLDGPYATRCRTFHCKLVDSSITNLNDQVNEWIDAHPEVQVKFASTTVGVVEGKHNDPHLIVTLFY